MKNCSIKVSLMLNNITLYRKSNMELFQTAKYVLYELNKTQIKKKIKKNHALSIDIKQFPKLLEIFNRTLSFRQIMY